MTYTPCVFDVETSLAEYLGRKGSPFSGGEVALCAAGFKIPGQAYQDTYFVKEVDGQRTGTQRGTKEWRDSFPSLEHIDILVGHNIKFDLLWYWRHPELEKFLKRGGLIWDTLYAEYLLSGQVYSIDQAPQWRPTLANVAKRRGVTRKLDVVAALWEQGVRTEDIQEQVLREYQKGDTISTYEIYLQQIDQAVRQNQLHMIRDRMDGLLATTEMEFNGLKIDLDEAETTLAKLSIEAEERAKALHKYLPEFPEGLVFNWGSPNMLSALLFGGFITYEAQAIVYDLDGFPTYYQKKERQPVLDANGEPVKYVSGKNAGKVKTRMVTVPDLARGPKTRKEKFYHEMPRLTKPSSRWASDGNKELNDERFMKWSTSADILEELGKRDIGLVKDLLALRGLEKDIGTYYKRFYKGKWTGMMTMVDEDGFIHHNLNHAITKTTRLSSSKPNLQNLSGADKSRVKAMFISRFGDDGLMAEGDYGQLEVVCKGVLSGDKALLKALIDGVCFHCDWLSLSPMAEGKTYDEIVHLVKVAHDEVWILKRKRIKPLTFGEAYGAGPASLAQDTGMSIEDVETAIANRKLKYPKLYEYDDNNIASVKASRKLSQFFTEGGHRAGIGYLRTATDTIYHFIEKDAPDWLQKQGQYTSFKPTTIKNYPSQGLGGEIMQCSLGRIFRWLLANDRFNDKVLLVNTVHDCCWFDLHKDYEHVLHTAKEIMEDVCGYYNTHYPNVNWDTPFPAEFEVGPSMYELEPMGA